MEENLKTNSGLGENPLQKLATIKYPFNLPANFPLISIRVYLEKQGISLADVYKILKPDDNNVAESLGLSPEEYKIVTFSTEESYLKEIYKIDELDQLKKTDKFIAQTGITYNKLQSLLDDYSKIKGLAAAEKLTIDSTNNTIKNISNHALGLLQFIYLKEVYGIDQSLDQLKVVDKFITQINIDYDKLERLLACYNEVKKTSTPNVPKLAIDSTNKTIKSNDETIEKDTQALGFLHRFIRLANKLSWSFDELCEVLIAIGKNEIDAGSLKQISRIKSLEEKFKKPLIEVCKLYPKASISMKESTSKEEADKVNEEDANNAAESLFFLQGVKESDLRKVYGIGEPSEPFKEQSVDEFTTQTGIKREKVEQLLNNYNKIGSQSISKKAKKPLNTEIRSTINVKEQKFLYNFTQLVEQLKLLFKKLGELTKALPSEFKLKDLVTNVNNSIILQKIWNVSDNELTSLVNYNDEVSGKTGKSLILEVHKQILLARLMNISIAELIQILLQLNINELSQDKIEDIIELNDWLTSNSITIEQLGTLVNSSALSHQYTGQISKIYEELEKDPELKRDEKAFYNAILQCIGEGDSQLRSVNEDILTATHKFTKKHATSLQLLRLESLDKSIVHDIGIIGNKAIFLEESKVLKKNSIEYSIREPRENVAVATVGTKAIFFGGKKGENEYSKKIDIYDKGTRSWSTEVASEARDSAAAAVVGSKVIFFGGNKSRRECSSQIDIYDNETKKWMPSADIKKASEARANASVAVIGEKAIFFGGEINNTRSRAIDIYDSKTNIWTAPKASEARANASVAVVDTKVIFFGGNKGGNQPSAKVDIYDSAEIDIYRTDPRKRWTTHTISEARENASVAIVDGKAIFFGGKAGQTRSNKIDIYDAKTEKWIAVKHAASEARDMASVAEVNKQAIFFGGSKGNQQYSKQIDIYDSATDSWKATDEISEAHENISVAVIGTKAMFFTGKKDSRITGQVYIYDSTNYSINDSTDDFITKSWMKRVAKENEMRDGLLAEIVNSTKYSGKVDIYDNTAKTWKAIDIYKPHECTKISVRNNKAILTFKNLKNTYEQTYSISLSITYDVTIEELLNNAAVFTTLKMDAEDINNITNHKDIYKLKATWTEKQIRTLTNYKVLQDEFSGNQLTLSQYTEWLRDSYDESKVTEKIAQLTNWNKELLNQIKGIDAFKQRFEKEYNPIDSLLKIKSFMDISEQSGIDGKILLELKDLHNLPVSTGWDKYNGAEKRLRESLSFVEGVKEQLEDQKRNILAGYMLYTYSEIKNKNMRGLYAFLLIDVEMSDCSNISPLKAGLNSLQLYIHRCILGLEEGVAVDTELTEEMWDLLNNYREWEVTKKIALYPENYLNPTLRKSATAEYKALQNTLMQGDITDETVAYAYIKYFEDFAQLVDLQIVDTYFASEKKSLYILGRTTAEPYTYYYRVGNFENDTNTSPQKWEPWQKIEVQVTASIARIIHAFGKIFVFWLHKSEKVKQIGLDISINDSILNVYYAFKKVDGSWSAQQKLPYDIKIDGRFESNIMKYYYSREQYKNCKNICENYKAKDNSTTIYYSEWVDGKDVNDAITYFEDKIKGLDKEIKEEAQESKDINTEFYGKLQVTFEGKSLLIISMEKDFDNTKFTLDKNFYFRISHCSWAEEEYEVHKAPNLSASLASITSLYQEEKEKYDKDISDKEAQLEAKKSDISKSENTRSALQKELGNKKAEEESLQNVIGPVEKIDDLEQEVKNVEESLSELPQHLQDSLEKVQAEKGKIPEAVNNLEQRLRSSKQKVEEELTAQSGRVTEEKKNLEANIDRLTEEIGDLELEKVTADQSKIEGLDAQISAKKKEKEECENQKQSLAVLELFESLEQKVTVAEIGKLSKEIRDFISELKQGGIDQVQKDELNKKIDSRHKKIKEFDDKKSSLEARQKLTELEVNITTVKDKIQALKDVETLKGDIDKLDEQIKTEDETIEKLKGEKTSLEIDIRILGRGKGKHFEELDKQEEQDKATTRKLFSYEKDISNTVINLIGELYTKAYIEGSGAILAPEAQQQILDFEGFYGVYLWEMFFHIPTLIAYLFNQEQKFPEARKWYQYVFNPIKRGCDAWQFIPFKTKCKNPSNINDPCDSGKLVDSLDPYKEADKKKTSYEKYAIMSYVDNLIDWGDMLFSQNSWEGINQATMLYIRAWDLLGEKPKKKGKYVIKELKKVSQLLDNKSNIYKIESDVPLDTAQRNALNTNGAAKALDTTVYCSYFCTPENKEFINLWDTIEDRLYKIRHCLDIKGKRLELPLFQPPIDPRQLIGAAAGGSTMRLPKIAQVPHYRFKYMITYAKSTADTVTQIGSELLSVLEKKDAEALTILYNKQEGIMASLITVIKEKAVEALKEEAKALDISLSSAKDRKSHYEKLINDGLLPSEKEAQKLFEDAHTIRIVTTAIRGIAAGTHLIPTVFGFACGALQPGFATEAGANVADSIANLMSEQAQIISTSASYERREQDWDLQKIMATYDVEQISYQIEANKINQANAEQDLKAHRESIKQIKEKEEFFRSKFTSQELYSWMKGELKSLYIKVYRLALEIAKQAERAYQYEIDNDKTFIQPGHWNSLKEGLLSGQKLKFDLEQLDKEYHDTNERRLEIAKVISLEHLDPIALYELKTKGSCKFSFTEKLFDLDFPGHYARKIKDIKLTIPAVVGPYENIHAGLQQTSNQVVLKSDGAINAIKYLVNPGEEEQPETDLLRVNWKPNQEIAISKADQDSGLFELSFGDERYLPFEGTGAVSTWKLSLPQATNRFDISTISDVIIHMDYTALNGGEALSSQVKNLNQLKYYHGTLVANLSALYPAEWERFKQAKGRSSELNFKLSPEIFPVYIKDPSVDLNGENNICIIPITPDISRMTIKLNNYGWERNSKKVVNPSLTIGSDWNIRINNADISKVEEIIIMVPYKATISW